MNIAPFIKEIGRGKDGARSLKVDQAHALMSAVLDGQVNDLQLGAFAIAMRIKGESADELAGFLAATEARCIALDPCRPTVVLPSYNGSRKLPNLTALLGQLLAHNGIQVLVHGPLNDPARVTTAEIFRDLGLPIARDAAEIDNAWRRREPVFIATENLCPPLAQLLAIRWTVGLRNSGHTIAKLLDPCRGHSSVRVVNYTHPEYGRMLTGFLCRIGADAMLLRGTEGEPAADPRRTPKMDVFVRGVARADLSLAAQDGTLAELPVLPKATDAATTALYIQSVVSGAKPAPTPLTQQVACIGRVFEAMQSPSASEQLA